MSDFETVREFLGYIDYREHQGGNPWEALRMIEDRLRDAEERAAVKEPFDYIEGLEARLREAEEVVEAAKQSPQSDELFQALLRYEEKKK